MVDEHPRTVAESSTYTVALRKLCDIRTAGLQRICRAVSSFPPPEANHALQVELRPSANARLLVLAGSFQLEGVEDYPNTNVQTVSRVDENVRTR